MVTTSKHHAPMCTSISAPPVRWETSHMAVAANWWTTPHVMLFRNISMAKSLWIASIRWWATMLEHSEGAGCEGSNRSKRLLWGKSWIFMENHRKLKVFRWILLTTYQSRYAWSTMRFVCKGSLKNTLKFWCTLFWLTTSSNQPVMQIFFSFLSWYLPIDLWDLWLRGVQGHSLPWVQQGWSVAWIALCIAHFCQLPHFFFKVEGWCSSTRRKQKKPKKRCFTGWSQRRSLCLYVSTFPHLLIETAILVRSWLKQSFGPICLLKPPRSLVSQHPSLPWFQRQIWSLFQWWPVWFLKL